MKQMGHTEFRPAIARLAEAVEVTSHGESMGYWIPKDSPEWKVFRAAMPKAPASRQVVNLEPHTPGVSPHDEARNRQKARDEVLRKLAKS